MQQSPILALNSGSSSIKFSLWQADSTQPRKNFEGAVEGISTEFCKFWIKDANGTLLVNQTPSLPTLTAAFQLIADALRSGKLPAPAAIGHRLVSGGPTILDNQRITPELVDEMERYAHFAPLHIPIAVSIMRASLKLFPNVPNFACLDTWFHRTLPAVAQQLPIPREYTEMGVRRYGAHGISYESIVHQLAPSVPEKLIVTHLGNGASIAAIHNGVSIDTSMGLTPTGGLISGTRTGDIDPGVLLFILRNIAATSPATSDAADKLETVANKQSGLVGASGISGDMRELREAIAKGNSAARLAVDQFVMAIRKWVGAYTTVLGGLDMLVFTGGIGQHDSATRAEVCAGLRTLGVVLDPDRNKAQDATIISADNSAVAVRVLPPKEELIIVNHVVQLLG